MISTLIRPLFPRLNTNDAIEEKQRIAVSVSKVSISFELLAKHQLACANCAPASDGGTAPC
jgi:hypothetical protein